MTIVDLHLKPPPPRTYGHDVEEGDLVKTRSQYTQGQVTKFENGQVTIDIYWHRKDGPRGLTTVPVEDVIVELSWWLHKIRVWMKAVDPTYDDFVSDYIARGDFLRMKREQVEARKEARARKKRPTA